MKNAILCQRSIPVLEHPILNSNCRIETFKNFFFQPDLFKLFFLQHEQKCISISRYFYFFASHKIIIYNVVTHLSYFARKINFMIIVFPLNKILVCKWVYLNILTLVLERSVTSLTFFWEIMTNQPIYQQTGMRVHWEGQRTDERWSAI